MLYMFGNKLKKVTSLYKDNLAVQTSIDNYKDFIKNIEKHQQKLKDSSIRDDKRDQYKPKIVIIGGESNKNSPKKQTDSF